jgi:hypothetical protein
MATAICSSCSWWNIAPGDGVLALQATMEVEPADKLLSLVLRVILMIDPVGIQGSECEEAVNLLTRKAFLL